MPILALALLMQIADAPPAPAAEPGEQTFAVWIAAPMTKDSHWLAVTVGDDCNDSVNLDRDPPVEIVWHRDRRTPIGREELRAGTQLYLTGPSRWEIRRIEVVCLGPLALDVAMEEWIASLPETRLSDGLTTSEMATVEAWGSVSWLVRDAVSKAVREKGSRALRLLVWSVKKSPDAEVRARARTLLVLLGWTE